MNATELLAVISRREQDNLSTTRVRMSEQDATELRDAITGKVSEGKVVAGTRVQHVFGVEIYVDQDLRPGQTACE